MIVNTTDIFPIHKIDGNFILNKNGDFSFLFSLDLPEIYSLSESDFDTIHSDLFKFCRMFSGCVIHLQHIFLEEKYDSSILPNNNFLQKATANYFNGRVYLHHYCFLYLTFTNVKSLSRGYINSAIFQKENLFKEDRKRLDAFTVEVERATALLNTSKHIKLSPLDDIQVKALIFHYMNGFSNGKLTDIIFKPDFTIGDNFFNSYAINSLFNQPETISNCLVDIKMSSDKYKFYKGFLDGLCLDLDCNHILNEIIYVDDHYEHKEIFRKAHKTFKIFSKFAIENDNAEKELDKYLNEIESDEKIQLCRGHVNLLVWSKDKDKLRQIDNSVVSKFREVDIIPYHSTYIDYIYYFLGCIPGNAGTIPKEETFTTDLLKAINYLSYTTNYKSDSSGIIFNDRKFNLPVLIDDWEEPYKSKLITSRNTFVIAPTGGGKSFLLNHIFRQSIENDFILTLIDLGGSYEKLAYLYPEKTAYIQYKAGEPLGINPFLIRTKEEITPDKIKTLADFNFILWKKDKEPSDVERISMYKIIQQYYKDNSKNFSFKSFYNYVKERKSLLTDLEIDSVFFNKDEFVYVCSEYFKGMYDFLLEDKNNTYYLADKQLIIYELESVRDNLDVLPIMLMMIRDTFENIVYHNKTANKRIWFEEAAKLLKNPVMLKTIDYFNQTIRKHNGSVGLVLQSINQIPETEIGKSIIANTHIHYLLKHEDFKDLNNKLKLSDHDIFQLMSIRNDLSGDRPYTEFLMKMGSRSNVYRLEVPREVYLAYLSEGDDKFRIMQEYKKTGSMETAIKNLLKP